MKIAEFTALKPLDEIAMKYTSNSCLAVSQGLIQGRTHLEGVVYDR
jgi:hypothetical protein